MDCEYMEESQYLLMGGICGVSENERNPRLQSFRGKQPEEKSCMH